MYDSGSYVEPPLDFERKAQRQMGIRFRCPQGHQLNVKTELAGKRGVCPQCGAKVEIPQSPAQQPSPSGGGSEVARAGGETQSKTPSSPSPSPADGGGGIEPQAEVARLEAKVAKQQAAAAPQAAVEDAWYVRPPAGGQFGPASSSDFAQWIRDGRVVPEAYVWRAGWPDWRKAGEVSDLPASIPAVAAPAATPMVEPAAGLGTPAVIVPDRAKATPRLAVRRKRSAKRQLTVAALLLIVTIILAGVFIWVLNREPPETSRATGCLTSYNLIG